MNIRFSPPDISELEIQEVVETLKSGWITTGPRTKTLEKQIAEYVGTPKCVCLNSQTACAEMALRLLGIGDGDEVITTAYTYTASASVVCHVGAKLILVDTLKDSLEPDYDAIEAAITDRTKAVIPVDVAGIPCDYDRIYKIVNGKKGLFTPTSDLQKKLGRVAVLADTAHSFGASRHGKPAGSIADFSAFSFHAVKNFTTAEGGALTWKHIEGVSDDELYSRLQLLSLHGQSKDAITKERLGSWEYDILGTWYKCNMTDIAAAMGIAQMKRYGEMLRRRKELIERYDAALKPLGIKVLPHYTSDYASSGHLYMTRIPNITVEQRNDIITKMAAADVACNVHYKPLPMLTAYKNMGFDIKNYPNSYDFYKNEITLPLHTRLTDEEVEYLLNTYLSVVREYLNADKKMG